MKYRRKKWQLFYKKINAPKSILKKIYNNRLYLIEYLEYDLIDKVSIDCLIPDDKKLVKKFGIEKFENFDLELLENFWDFAVINVREILEEIPSTTEDLNNTIYELIKYKISPNDFTSKMKEKYKNLYFEITNNMNDSEKKIAEGYNRGFLTIEDIIENWDFIKDKDLTYILIESYSWENYTETDLREFMTKYGDIFLLYDSSNYRSILNKYAKSENKEEYILEIITDILNIKNLNEEQKRIINKYLQIDKLLDCMNINEEIKKELKNYSKEYILSLNLPLSIFEDYNVEQTFIAYGFKNVMEFDRKNNNFLTKDNYNMLKNINIYFLHYAPYFGESTLYDIPIEEAMKRMIIYGPTDGKYTHDFDYRDLYGDFRNSHPELFITDDAPEELKNQFYTRTLDLKILSDHPEYLKYLENKNLACCVDRPLLSLSYGTSPEKMFDYLYQNEKSDRIKTFLLEYNEIINITSQVHLNLKYEEMLLEGKVLDSIKEELNNILYEKITKENMLYPKTIPTEFKNNHPGLFLSEDAPEELKEAFYSRNINTEYMLNHPEYLKYLKEVDLNILYKYMPVYIKSKEKNFINLIKESLKEDTFDFMLLYGKYIEILHERNYLQHCIPNFVDDFNNPIYKDDKNIIINAIEDEIYATIMTGEIFYNSDMPLHFKNKYPELFVSESLPDEIKNKFYNKKLEVQDFINNPTLIDEFGVTDILLGFPGECMKINKIFNFSKPSKEINAKKIKILFEYSKIENYELKEMFMDFVLNEDENKLYDKLKYVSEVLERLSSSNSAEMIRFAKQLASQIIYTDNPINNLNKIENIFLKNNIPTVGKIFACFKILHPEYNDFQFYTYLSPTLRKGSNLSNDIIIFSDLIKAAFGSNNRAVLSYIENIEIGYKIYQKVLNNNLSINDLSTEEQEELLIFSKHLATLYNNSMKGKKDDVFTNTDDLISDIKKISEKLSLNGEIDYYIPDRIIRMFCGFVGISTLEEAKSYIKTKISQADKRNREAAKKPITFEKGDLVKGIGGIKYLGSILQNGSVAKEFLGESATSDSTPLDTDVCVLEHDGIENASSYHGYGPIFFVLKNNDRFIITRNREGNIDVKDKSKIELFYTGTIGIDHYGIRTGFASSEIDYIVTETYDTKIGLEIALNGFYIPVVNSKGEILFSPKDYDKLREKMSGLSYYGLNEYKFSSNLSTPEIDLIVEQLEENDKDIYNKKRKISSAIAEVLKEFNLELKNEIDGDLTEGTVELIDTGSTARGTNKPGTGDFDYMLRLDKKIFKKPELLQQIKNALSEKFSKRDSKGIISSGDFRFKNVIIDDEILDIDISFTEKTDKTLYSTDMSLKDRLETIRKNDYEKYRYIQANIIFAKQLLKEKGCYKKYSSDNTQGGLGGVGIENWILQNGGSFIDAARDFMNSASGKTFEKFKEIYQIWDFGENHMAPEKGLYPHDNFVMNMSEGGYNKMKEALKEFLDKYDYTENKRRTM